MLDWFFCKTEKRWSRDLGEKRIKNKTLSDEPFLFSLNSLFLAPSAGGIGCLDHDRGQARQCLDVVEIYNPDGNYWREGPPMPYPLLSLRTNSTCAGAVEGKLYVCGGFRGTGLEKSKENVVMFAMCFKNHPKYHYPNLHRIPSQFEFVCLSVCLIPAP